jgi:hypothetical protein
MDRVTRISTTSVVASAGTVFASALAVMLTAGITFADNNAPVERDIDLPIEAPAHFVPAAQKPPAPPAPAPTASQPVDSSVPATFFGHDIQNTGSIVYVVDQSGSMCLQVAPFTNQNGQVVTGGCRMDRAKAELIKSITALPASFIFDVIFYDECVRPWQSSSVPASAANKALAITYITAQQPMGFTNTGLGVATALQDKSNKSVVLLSDGEPNFLDCACNYVGTYDQHEQIIKQANSQNARIDCFGIGVTGDADAMNFMIAVAAQNSGTYVNID